MMRSGLSAGELTVSALAGFGRVGEVMDIGL
jgi:hypothetical protein